MIGVKIRYFRKRLNLSQQEFGQMIGKPQTTISDWENEKTLPDIDEAVKLVAALGVTITELLNEPEK